MEERSYEKHWFDSSPDTVVYNLHIIWVSPREVVGGSGSTPGNLITANIVHQSPRHGEWISGCFSLALT